MTAAVAGPGLAGEPVRVCAARKCRRPVAARRRFCSQACRVKSLPAPRLQERDALMHEWLTQQWGAGMDQVADMCGVTPARVYQLVERWLAAERVHAERIAGNDDASGRLWVYPTRATAWAYLGYDPGPWMPRPSTAAHVRAVGELRYALLGLNTDPERWTSERVLLHRLAPSRPGGAPGARGHVHDGWYCDEQGRRWAIEVELTLKRGSGRLQAALHAAVVAARQHQLAGVLYFARGAALVSALESAAAELAAAEKTPKVAGLHIRELDKTITQHRAARAKKSLPAGDPGAAEETE